MPGEQTTDPNQTTFRARAWRAFWRGFWDGFTGPATFLLGCRDGLLGLFGKQ